MIILFHKHLQLLESVCPVGIAISNEHLRLTQGKSLADVFEIEFRGVRYQQR